MTAIRKSPPSHSGRRGLALIPVLALVVLLTLFVSLLTQRQVRNHRAFETARRSAMARQIARSEADRIARLIAAGKAIATTSRVIAAADIPGLPEPVAVAVEKPDPRSKGYRVAVRIPAGADTAVQEIVIIP
jgi:Tfp pilus assembly protein PilX